MSRNRSEPFGHREPEPQISKGERISSPLQPIQTPAVTEDEKPYGIKARLEREEGDIFEAIGDLVSRQNNLMEKKCNTWENVGEKLTFYFSFFGKPKRECFKEIKDSCSTTK